MNKRQRLRRVGTALRYRSETDRQTNKQTRHRAHLYPANDFDWDGCNTKTPIQRNLTTTTQAHGNRVGQILCLTRNRQTNYLPVVPRSARPTTGILASTARLTTETRQATFKSIAPTQVDLTSNWVSQQQSPQHAQTQKTTSADEHNDQRQLHNQRTASSSKTLNNQFSCSSKKTSKATTQQNSCKQQRRTRFSL